MPKHGLVKTGSRKTTHMKNALLIIIAFIFTNTLMAETIDSVQYNANIGEFTVFGKNFKTDGGVDPAQIEITGAAGSTYQLTSISNVSTYSTTISFTVDDVDRGYMNWLLDKNGQTSIAATSYIFDAKNKWNGNTTGNITSSITVYNFQPPNITSATYDAETGIFVVTGERFARDDIGDDIVATNLTIEDAGGTVVNITNSLSNTEITNHTSFTITLEADDKNNVDQLIDRNGTSSSQGNDYYIRGTNGWNAASAADDTDNENNAITASNVFTITDVAYNSTNGTLILSGSGFETSENIDPTLLTIHGESSDSYALTAATPAVTPNSSTSAILSIEGLDRASLNSILNKDGTTAISGDNFYLDAAAGWNGTSSPERINNSLTVSNFQPPQITSTTYDASTGTFAVTGTNLAHDGTSDDIDATHFIIEEDGGTTYNITIAVANINVTDHTSFSFTVDAADKTDIDQIIDRNGTSSSQGNDYYIKGTDGWNAASAADNTDNGNNLLAASNVIAITNVAYNSIDGTLSLTGTGFNTGSTINPTNLEIYGQNGNSYILTNATAAANPASSTSAELTISGIDRANINHLLNQNGTSAISTDGYILNATANWNGTSPARSDNIISVSNFQPPQITSATYDASTGTFAVTGTNLAHDGSGNDIDITKIKIEDAGAATYTISTPVTSVEVPDHTGFTFTVGSSNKTNIDQIINKNGTKSLNNNDYYIRGIEDWNTASASTDADNGNNNITASNVITITNVSYNASTSTLNFSGTGFNTGATIDPAQITITGENGNSFTLNETTGVTPSSATFASITISGMDRAYLNALLNQNGKTAISGNDFILDANTGWNGASTPTRLNNEITVSNFQPPQITSATYDANTGILVVTATNLATDAGAANDIDASQLTIFGLASNSHTLAEGTTNDVEITSTTEFTLTISGADKTAIDNLLDINGTSASDGVNYNLSGANGWNSPSAAFHPDNGPNTITVSNQPLTANATASTTTICESETITLSANASGGTGSYSYIWTSSATTFTSTDENPELTPQATTIYTVEVDDGSTINTSNVSVTVKPIPQFTSTTDTTFCSGLTFNYTAKSDVAGTTFSWTRNAVSGIDEPLATGTTETISETLTNNKTSPVTTSYDFELDAAGCTNSATVQVTVNPNGQVVIPSDQVICAGGNSDYVDFSTTNTVGTTTFSWSNDNTSIGLLTSGSGNISSFTATNSNKNQIAANIEVTPTFTYNAYSCTGSPETFQYRINPAPQVNKPADQTLCNGEATTAINFSTNNTDGITTYEWTNDNTAINLATNGTGDIASFTAQNSNDYPITATISVTPVYTNESVSCTGNPVSFTITVNPNGQVNPISTQNYCAGEDTDYTHFSTTNTMGTTTFNWTNSNTTIGLADALGSGDIAAFETQNSNTNAISTTIEVTPSFTYNSTTCPGSSGTYDINVNPPAQVDQPANIIVCNNSNVAQINFTTANTDGSTTYSWSTDNPSVGISPSGTGSIPAFTATSNGTSPEEATVTVIPEYTNNGITCTGTSKSFTITVYPNGQVNAVADQEICHNTEFTNILFSTANTGETTDYVWTNDNTSIGLTNSGSGNIPAFTGINTDQTPDTANITVTPYFNGYPGGCAGTPIQFKLIVKPLPDVSFAMPQSTYSNDAPADTIHGATPPGGLFSGPGIIATDSTFHPSSAGDGNHTITYTYPSSASLGCQNTATDNVSVVPPGGTINGIDAHYCDNLQPDTLYGHVGPGGTLSEPDCGFHLIEGMTLINDSVAIIDPTMLPKGDIEIKFTYYKGTYFHILENTTVYEIDNIASFSGLLSEYCVNSDSTKLISEPSGGTFYGGGVVDDYFKPWIAGAGASEVEYVYNIPSTICYDTAVNTSTVHSLPDVSLTYDTSYCANSDQAPIVGDQGDGIFSGPNLSGSGDTVWFSPSANIVGSHNITYEYTDLNGCTNSTEQPLEVTAIANVGIESIESAYCVNNDSIEIVGEIFGIVEDTGSFYGPGVFDGDSTDGRAYFHPEIAGTGGPYDVTYEYTDENGCTATYTAEVSVQKLPEVSINNLDPKFCFGDDAVTIEGFPKNANGAFSYSGNNADLDDNDDGTALFSPNHTITNGEVTYTYTDELGCTNSTTQLVDVADLPNVSFTCESVFCPDGEEVNIIGNPRGGVFTGPNLTGQDSVIFIPNSSIIGNHTITYTYSDENGCQNSHAEPIEVVELPLLGVTSLQNGYCINANEIQISGLADGAAANAGEFTGSIVYDTNTTDGEAYIYPDSATTEGTYEIIFTYTDENTCVSTYETSIEIFELPEVSIFNLDPLYCEEDDAITVSGSPGNSNGSFSYSGAGGDLIDNGDGTALFEPGTIITDGVVTYAYTDENGCQNSTHDTVTVSPLPEVDFSVGSFCVGDTINFIDETSSATDLDAWLWNFGDPLSDDNTSTLSNPDHFYENPGEKDIQLTVTTIDGCSSSSTQTIDFDNSPEVDFSWENECAGIGTTSFTNLSNDTTTILWEFGDGATSDQVNTTHAYADEGAYDVTLSVANSFGCETVVSKTVHVRPYIQNFPYIQDFEGETSGGWLVDVNHTNSSWEYGTPNGVIIDHTIDGETAWCTGLSNNHNDGEQSAIVSPCFDFSAFKKPMFKLDIWSATQKDADGAVLQAKVVGETDWTNVGNPNDAINWYNGIGLTGNPGGEDNIGSYGWTGVDSNWVDARHKLDFLIGKENVRFRIAFGSDNGGNYDGFAFDNISIGERSKLVFIESFINNSSNESGQINDDLTNLLEQNPLDIVDVQYHTSFPGSDEFNSHNPIDPSARSTYYGVTNVPWSVVNGNKFSGTTNNMLADTKILDEQSLENPRFSVDIETTKTDAHIDINATIKAKSSLSARNITVHTVIIEKEVSSVTAPNGETVFLSIMKKMLPNAGGTYFSHAWSPGQTENIELSWDFENVYNAEQIETIMFVQDENTREIFQAGTDDTTVNQVGTKQILIDMHEKPFIVYPNPTRKDFTVLLHSRLHADGLLTIYNNVGTIISQKKISKGEHAIQTEFKNNTPGLYFIRIQTKNKIIGTERLIQK